MLKKEIVDLLNKQINMELFSAYLYHEMANFYHYKSLDGFGHWLDIQVQEEVSHAELIKNYLLDNDERVKLKGIDDPSKDFEDFKTPLEEALKHERLITASINKICTMAVKHEDYRTRQFLDWFVAEQAEEEANFSQLIDKYDLFAGDGKGLYMLDQEMSLRVFTPPSIAGA